MATDSADTHADGDRATTPPLWRRALRRLGDVVVPPVCIACHQRVGSHDALCARCWRTIAFVRPPACDRLGIPLPYGRPDGGPLISAAAAADPPPYDRARAVAVFAHDSVIRDLVHGFKFADRHEPRRLFARWMVDAGREILTDCDLIVPVPLTRWRLMRRQFNQSAMLAREIARATGIATDPHALIKTRTTPPQVGLTREQRRVNVRGAFAVPDRRRDAITGKRVLIVDDVITTGATVGACTRALRDAGAARVDVLAIGIVTTPGQVTP